MPGTSPSEMPPIGRAGTAWRILLVFGLGLAAWATVVASLPDAVPLWKETWLLVLDPILGIVAAVLAYWRRRYPIAVAVAVTAIGIVSAASGGAVVLVLASVATRRQWRELAWLVPLNIASGWAVEQYYPSPPGSAAPWPVTVALVVLMIAVVVAVGYAVGGRRELHRERAEAAERDAQRRAAQATAAERTRIAREMHDVLAHRISLVAMHAGALNYRTDLAPEQMSAALATIETNAHQALADLRDVLGVLREHRDAGSDSAPEPPQPGLADVPRLIEETEGLGTRIAYADSTAGQVPAGVGRTAYRIIQEALTNARKHAPGATVSVRLSGAAPAGLRVEVANPRAVQPVDHALPRSGLGLLGLEERVALAGGKLRHGTQAGGGYVVHAWLPWPEPARAGEGAR
jgi:signal transduction histidine kinase